MNLFALSCIITAALTAILCAVILLDNFKSKINKTWSLTCISVFVWLIGLYGTVAAGGRAQALFWQELLYLGTILIPAFFFYFCISFLQRKKQNKTSLIGFAIALFFIYLIPSKLFIVGITERTDFGYWPVQTGPLYWLFLAYFAFYMVYSIVLLKLDSKKYGGAYRKQIQFVYYAALIGVAGGSTNFLLDFNLNIYPFGNFFVIFYVVFVSYAILKHHLFNVKVIATEILTFSIWMILLMQLFLSPNLKTVMIDGALLTLVVVFGVFLIKSVLNEVKQREQLERVSNDLRDLKDNLEIKIQEQTVEIKRAYEVEKKARLELEELDKAKDQFILTTQHHLRTPLTIVKGYLSVLKEKFSLPKEAAVNVDKMQSAAENMSESINDLLKATEVKVREGETSKLQLT